MLGLPSEAGLAAACVQTAGKRKKKSARHAFFTRLCFVVKMILYFPFFQSRNAYFPEQNQTVEKIQEFRESLENRVLLFPSITTLRLKRFEVNFARKKIVAHQP